jgi:hypothetical protein
MQDVESWSYAVIDRPPTTDRQPCPRRPDWPSCQMAVQCGCPGAAECQKITDEQIARADAELARRRAAGEPPDRWATRSEDYE